MKSVSLGITIQADIIKQKLPEINGGFMALNTGGQFLKHVNHLDQLHKCVTLSSLNAFTLLWVN